MPDFPLPHLDMPGLGQGSGPGTQRIDLPATCPQCFATRGGRVALAQAKRAGMSFTPLSENEEGIARKTVHQKGY